MSRTSKEEIAYWDNFLDQYENSIGLPIYQQNSLPEEELQDYFTMGRDSLEKLTPEDCAQIAYRLAQYAFHVQRTLNREIARHNWAEETIKDVISNEINNYKGYGYVEKSLQAINNNAKAAALNSIKKHAKQRMDRLSYLANNIKNLSDILMMVNKSKANIKSYGN
jgi:hypothetical protein